MEKKKRKKSRSVIFLLFVVILVLLAKQYKDAHKENLRLNSPLPTGLNEMVANKREELIEKTAKIGINIVITEDFRSFEEQEKLYQQGRATEGTIVTNAKAGESYHNYGLAIDFALLNSNNVVIWDMDYDGNGNSKSDWMEVVAIAKQLGFEWGGDWKSFKDYPHLEMDFGLSIQDLQNGKRP